MMRSDILFSNRLAARLFGYFLLLALAPILAFGYFANWQTSRQMEETHEHYLLKTAVMFNQLFLSRLLQIEDALRLFRDDLASMNPQALSRSASAAHERRYFSRLVTRPARADTFSEPEWTHLRAGNVLLRLRDGASGEKGLVMVALFPGGGQYLEADILPQALWGVSEELPLPKDTSLRILSPQGDLLFGSEAEPRPLPGEAVTEVLSRMHGSIPIWGDEQPSVCYFREVFLGAHFVLPRWTLLLIQEQQEALASRTGFMGLFPLLVALCLGLVLYMILVLIRRTMTPLSELRNATNRLAAQDFDVRVDIRSGDEIEELGHAFNVMTKQLNRQFQTLNTQATIDREILSAMNVDAVVSTTLEYFTATFSPSSAVLCVRDGDVLRSFIRTGEHEFQVAVTAVDAKTFARLWGRVLHAGWIDAGEVPELKGLLPGGPERDGLVCSIPRHGSPMGFLFLGGVSTLDTSDLDLASRTLNQIAVAFTNIRLVRELHAFNWGTLEALARAVDEKSSWTQGHSNRVAALAMELAEQMGWSEADLDLLHRAALLHDLGKIGISEEILDKPGRLNEEEFAVIRTHPDRGAKILEPVTAYAPVIPMVRHHHERYDGSGYPAGLAGTTIPPGARILAVVDVYDAVSVTRPYRKAWSHAESCAYLRENAGVIFDPLVVDAFMTLWQPANEG